MVVTDSESESAMPLNQRRRRKGLQGRELQSLSRNREVVRRNSGRRISPGLLALKEE